jgi:dihydrofolate reductase
MGVWLMGTRVAGTFLTLDGVMQAPGGPDEDRDGGFVHGGWLVPFFDDTIGEIMAEWTRCAEAFLLGRRTYEIFAGSWPNATDPADEIAAVLNSRPKYVASRTLDRLDWHNARLLDGDVVDAVAALKAQTDGEIQVHGSGDLLQTLLAHDLVDTLRLWQFPVVTGGGKQLFGDGVPAQAFRLLDTAVAGTGAVLHVYERTGQLRYGEMEVGEETRVFDGDDSRP